MYVIISRSHLIPHLLFRQVRIVSGSWSITSIVLLCNTFLPNFRYLSVICSYITFRVFDANILNHTFSFPVPLFSCTLIKFCSGDLITDAGKICLLGIVCGSLQLVSQSSLVLPFIFDILPFHSPFHFIHPFY
jgi:hypothetical protein